MEKDSRFDDEDRAFTDDEMYAYDYMDVAVRANLEEVLCDCYTALGWDVVERQSMGRKSAMTHFSMMRAHDIPERDRRQFLQVQVETRANKAARIRRRAHKRSLALAVTMGIITVALIVLGALAVAYSEGAADYALGGVSLFAALVLVGVSVFFYVRMFRSESLRARRELLSCVRDIRGVYSAIKDTFSEG
ncbi:MAG: hypothetical protein LUD29_05730 [Clostridia bacterium]|nr:hypothetical protein [Clostridia bacterium]